MKDNRSDDTGDYNNEYNDSHQYRFFSRSWKSRFFDGGCWGYHDHNPDFPCIRVCISFCEDEGIIIWQEAGPVLAHLSRECQEIPRTIACICQVFSIILFE